MRLSITSTIPALQTKSTSPGLVVQNSYVQDLPLRIRNWDDLVGLGEFGDMKISLCRNLCDNPAYAVIPIPQSRERNLALSVFKAVQDSSSSRSDRDSSE